MRICSFPFCLVVLFFFPSSHLLSYFPPADFNMPKTAKKAAKGEEEGKKGKKGGVDKPKR